MEDSTPQEFFRATEVVTQYWVRFLSAVMLTGYRKWGLVESFLCIKDCFVMRADAYVSMYAIAYTYALYLILCELYHQSIFYNNKNKLDWLIDIYMWFSCYYQFPLSIQSCQENR